MNELNAKIDSGVSFTDNYYQRQTKDQQQVSANEFQLLSSYKSLMQDYSYAKINVNQIPAQKFEQHKITLLQNIYQPFGKNKIFQSSHDFLFSILHTQFYGLQYLYEIIISNLKLRVNILNLQRQADTGLDDIDSKQLGTGSFGEVRVLIVNDKKYAVKRIPFKYKLQPQEGFDYQVSKDQQQKLRGALKEYCYFKIFSLLGIGPKIVKSSYDLICFNNCIQFKMQLCQPLLNKIRDKQLEFNFCQYKKQLYQKLFMLHSINFVHRDIKPDNILYSPNQNCFVLGDFGLVSYSKQHFTQETQTRFVGTPNYCGKQMSKLLNGGSGFVNLYLNDLICLQKTIQYTGECLQSHNSRISENSLSFNATGSNYQSEGNTFSQDNYSEVHLTDYSYVPTRNSILTLPTAHTLAPQKYASSINHYQAEIIFTVCRTQQRRSFVSNDYLLKLIEQKQKQHKNKQISSNLWRQLCLTFHLFDQNSKTIKFIKEWKNLSRHFGPENIRTLLQLDKLIEISHENEKRILLQIKKNLKNFQSNLKQSKLQILLTKNMGNLQMFLSCFLTYLITLEKQFRKKQIEEDQYIFIAQQFIYMMRNGKQFFLYTKSINKLTVTLYSKCSTSINRNSSLIETLKFSLQYLTSKNKNQHIETLYYLHILSQLTHWSHNEPWEEAEKFIKGKLNQLFQKFNELSQEEGVILISLFIKISKWQKHQGNTQLDQNKFLQTANLLVQNQLQKVQKSILQKSFLLFLIQKVLLLSQGQKYEDAINLCNNILYELDKQTKQKQKIFSKEYALVYFKMGQIYNQQASYNLSLNCNLKALQILQKQIGCLNQPQLTFDILNNTLISYTESQMFQKYDQTLQQIVDFLEKAAHKHKYRKLTYIRQLQILRLQFIGLNDLYQKEKASFLIEKILEGFYQYVTKQCGNTTILDHTPPNHLVNIYQCKDVDKIYILTQIVNILQRKPNYCELMIEQYCFSNLQLAVYLKFTLNRNYDSIKYIWNALRLKLQKFHPCQLKERQYKNSILYVDCLIKANSSRVALRFLYTIVKYIPEAFKEIKYKAIKLMYKALQSIGDNKQNLFYQITKKDCRLLRNKCFVIQPQKLSKDRYFRILEFKYLKKICLAQMEQFQ